MTSKGEQKIEKLLTSARLNFKREYIFPDLYGYKKVPLRFDFAVFQGKKLVCLIEVDGRQHFEYVPHFHKTMSSFKRQQEWDRRKNKYCLMHGFPLIRVPYWSLENLSLQEIFTNPKFLVKDKFHNDNLRRQG